MDVAVVGLGRMGEALARRLLDQGVALTVWNRSAEPAERLQGAGATVAGRVADVWSRARTAMTFLANDQAVEAVCLAPDGLLASAPEGAVLIEMSTISPESSARVADMAATRGVAYLRCPVSGNPGVLAAGNLLLIVSGERTAYERARAVLDLVAEKSHYVGGGDEARLVKLAVNAVLAATTQMLAETVALCEAAGIERGAYLDVLAASAIGSPFIRYKRDALVAREYTATFTTAMLGKDLRLVLDAAATSRTPMPATSLVAELTAAAAAHGLADCDFLALLPYLQMLAGRPTDVPVTASSGE